MLQFEQLQKKYCLYCRTNRRVQWRYAEYGGRYETVEKAIESAKQHYSEKVEYRVESLDKTLIETGFINKHLHAQQK